MFNLNSSSPIVGIEALHFAVKDLAKCQQFMLDWGLTQVTAYEHQACFETLTGAKVLLADQHDLPAHWPAGIEPDPTLREVVWGVRDANALETLASSLVHHPHFGRDEHSVWLLDPNGVGVRLQISQKRMVSVTSATTNTWTHRPRINEPAPQYAKAQPIDIGHVVFFVANLHEVSRFYQEHLGFVLSDQYPERGDFLRCSAIGGHHDLFLLQTPQGRKGLNHVAFMVRDLHEVVGGGLYMDRQGWISELGPGRHPISSAMFWYMISPCGGLMEYYTDEDELTAEWQPRRFDPHPTLFAEWAIKGGLDGHHRRQKNTSSNDQFLTDRPPTPTPTPTTPTPTPPIPNNN